MLAKFALIVLNRRYFSEITLDEIIIIFLLIIIVVVFYREILYSI